jgi:hypothetical protein
VKQYKLAFDLLEYLINYFDINQIFQSIKESFYNLLVIYQSLQGGEKKQIIEFSRQLVVFFSKFLIKNSPKVLIDILESISQGATTILLRDLCSQLPDLDNNRDKKIVNYAYCSILNDYYSLFDTETLKYLTKYVITHLTNFNKYGINVNINDNKFKLGEDCTYDGTSFNKILNADVKVCCLY